MPAATPILVPQHRVRKLALWVLVEHLHVAVRGRAVEVEIIFLDVFAVVSLTRREPEQPLLQNRIAAIPERQGETQDLITVANPGDAVFAPTVRFASSE